MKPEYPLLPLETLRDARLAEREHALGAALRELETARSRLAAAEADLSRARDEQERARGAEAALLAAGSLRALDLAQHATHAERERERLAALQLQVHNAEQSVSAALQAETAAREALARARAEQQSVVEHKKVWQAARERKDELQAEEAATEQWNARQKRSEPV